MLLMMKNPDVMEMQGLVHFLKDLEITPDDIALLVIGYHLKAKIIGRFTKDEFVLGFIKLNLGSIESIKEMIPEFRQSVNQDEDTLKEIFKYSHQFYREKLIHKTIPLDTAAHVLKTLLPSCPYISQFQKFIMKQREYKAINLDQWVNIYDFCTTMSMSESSILEYSEGSSWPYLIDLFVEWFKEGHSGDSEEDVHDKSQAVDGNEASLLDCKYYKL